MDLHHMEEPMISKRVEVVARTLDPEAWPERLFEDDIIYAIFKDRRDASIAKAKEVLIALRDDFKAQRELVDAAAADYHEALRDPEVKTWEEMPEFCRDGMRGPMRDAIFAALTVES
jgi:hypothetical protein